MNILAIGAHADDVELGAGGSLVKWAREGHKITIYTATDSEYMAPDKTLIRSASVARQESEEAAKVIGAKLIVGPFQCFNLTFGETLNTALIKIIDQENPDLIVSHWSDDTHPDHQAIARSTLHAAKHIPRVLQYASNWYMGSEVFEARYFTDISDTLEEKLNLIRLYSSEHGRSDGIWVDYFCTQAAMYGHINNVKFAEPFHLIRYLDG